MRRIEIGLHPQDGCLYITGVPGFPRSWFANVLADPAVALHLKQTMVTDLPATARPVTDPMERRQILTGILPRLADYTTPRSPRWIRKSPLIEVTLS